jgi:hypothetical protein
MVDRVITQLGSNLVKFRSRRPMMRCWWVHAILLNRVLSPPFCRHSVFAKGGIVLPIYLCLAHALSSLIGLFVYVRPSNGDSQRIRETEMFFDLQNDRLAPLYAISTGPRTEWSIQVLYSNSASQADYPLQTRSDAFKLQQAFIRYEIAAYSEQVSCATTYKKSWPQRDGQHVSGGEIQLLQ